MSSGEDGAFFLAQTARRRAEAPAIVHPAAGGAWTAISYAALDRASAAAAAALRGRGLRPGDRVALRLAPSPEYVALLLALLRAGIVAVPLSTRLPPGAVPGLLAAIGCATIVGSGGTERETPPGIAAVEAATLLAPPAGGPEATTPFDPRADATIVFTSGSSGRPKGVLHAAASHLASAAGANEALPFGPGDRWLLSLPLWHVGGLAILFRAFLGGGTVAVPAPGEPLAAALAASAATHVSLVATQLARLLRDEAAATSLAGLRLALLGGGPVPPALVREARARGVPVATSYGSTELAALATATRPGDPEDLLLTAGRPLRGREIAIAPDGEILARGATLMRGYVSAGGLDPARDADGWFHTGDLGEIDGDGCLRVTGRRDAMFVSGGENIHPEEIERELLRHPAVEETLVVAVPDAEFGARPVAFVRPRGTFPAAAELDAFLRRTLPGFKAPARYLPWPELPEGTKPLRRDLAALAARLARG